MKKFGLRLLGLVAFLMIIFNSCSKDNSSDNGPAPTTVAQDKENITNTFNDFYSCLNTLDDGDFSSFLLYSLFNSTDQQYDDSYIRYLMDQFELQYGAVVIEDKLQFDNRKGTYTWDQQSETWTKVSNSSAVILKFPSRYNGTSNDGELTFSAYTDMSTMYDAIEYWLPTSANLTLKRDGNLVFSLNLSNVTFDVGTNFSMPISANISVFTTPFSHTFKWERTSSTDFRLTYDSSTPNGCTTNSVTNIKLNDADYGNITSVKEDLRTVSGTLTEGNLKVVYAINVQSITANENPTPSQINNYSDAEVFYNNVKIGDLTYDEIEGQSEIFITYSDGSRENIDIYVGDFENQINAIFSNYIN